MSCVGGLDPNGNYWCNWIEAWVPVEDGDCKKVFGSAAGYFGCTYKKSLSCPLEAKK